MKTNKQEQENTSNGLFLVIEGSDGSGKGTQFKLLAERLKAEGYDVSTYDFPQYDKESSFHVREYLNGNYGTAESLGPYTPSLFYALDRYSASKQIAEDLRNGKVVLSNRYVGSNMAHQGTKFHTNEDRRAFFQWLDQLEFGMLGIPRPDLNVVLLVPAQIAQQLVDQKEARSYTTKKRDIHEADIQHLEKAVRVYQELCATFQNNFTAIDCTQDNKMISIPHINNLIWDKVEPMLKKLRRKNKTKLTEIIESKISKKSETNEYILKNENGSYSITTKGQEALLDSVSSTDKDVYVFTDKISTETVAAAMARLSRRGDDMRVTLLDEFMGKAGKDENLLRRVITAYGDDSVQQLTGIHFVVENASNLLTKKLEWGRLAAYLEQSTRYIYFDQKDQNGKFKYYTPKTLSNNETKHYEAKINEIFEKYSELVKKLTEYVRANSSTPESERDSPWKTATRAQACDAARAVLPVATTATVGIYASGQALESLIMHLQSDELDEARSTGDSLLIEARKVVPTFLERADKPDRGGAWIAHKAQTRMKVAELSKKKQLQPMKGESSEAVILTDYWPKNELDILSHTLYEQSTLSLAELEAETNKWSYTEKEEAMRTYIGERLNRRHKPGRAFEIPHYNFDLICDYGIFRDLQRHRMVDALQWQQLSPHYGYETPKLITDSGLEELYESCYEASLNLYQYLLENNHPYEAQYATLLGHKMRWKLMMNAREAYHFMELRTSPQGHPGYRKLTKQMYDALQNVHPIIASGMIFVNKGEDEELTRLAAERATQFKLDQMN